MANGKKQQSGIVQVSQVFQGPLPHPDVLVKYNEAQPGAADRIIRMAEKEQGHRHIIEKAAVIGNVVAEYVGLGLAAALFGGVAYGGFWLIKNGYQGAGIASVIGAILGPLVTYLVERRKSHS